MPETFEILKKRWVEVAVIVALGILRWLVPMVTAVAGISILRYLSQLLVMAIAAVILIARAGFLHTAHLYGDRRQRISTLLQTGKHFFWQLLVFYAMYGILMLLIGLLLVRVSLLYTSPSGLRTFLTWRFALCSIALAVALAKPLLLVPALIIIRNCRAFEGIKLVWSYKLLRAKELLLFFAIQQAFMLVPIFMPPPKEAGDISYHLTHAGNNIISSLLVIVVALSAVRFVAGETEKEDQVREVEIEE